ncbi:MAG: right-handed parallel beta-helix repeat-containing protein [Acidobacteria bacterium]|nr:right-handed parallel beta-helix repeat-containing protein [Acidobacteriota bacterium]
MTPWFLSLAAFFQAAATPPATAVATFESIGIYYPSPDLGPATVQFRASSSQQWREGYPPAYDPRLHEYRGSLVLLQPDTEYQIRIQAGERSAELTARTRTDAFPIGATTHLTESDAGQTLVIREGGSESAWRLYTPEPGKKWSSDLFNLADNNIVVEADYVILRGLELKGAAQHAILIKPGVQNVVVEDCRIAGWGRIGGARVWGIFYGSDSAVYAQKGAGHLVIQRNLIEHPRGGSNDWESGHPEGPQAISLLDSSGGNVIRFNTIRSTEDHGYNDGIGGGSNFSFAGSPNRDSDIYSNHISHCWDDAIESEGANMNVRIWSNYIHHTFTHVATASTSMGPLYIFRNIFGSSRVTHLDPSGGTIIKTGGRDVELNGEKLSTLLGARFIFHNTTLQPGGALDVFSGHPTHNAVTRNNIFYARGRTYPQPQPGPPNDFKHDLTGGYLGGGFVQSMFLPAQNLEWFLAPTMNKIKWGRIEYTRSGKTFAITDPLQPIPNPALDRAVRLPNFNDDFTGAAPDIGAYETGRPPLRFGREMAPGFRRAPWELY